MLAEYKALCLILCVQASSCNSYCFLYYQIYEDSIVLQSVLTNGKERITKDSDDSSDDSSDDDSDDSSDDSSDGDETDSKYSVSGIGPDMEIF